MASSVAPLIFALWVLYIAWKKWLAHRTDQAIVASNGCKPSVHLSNTWYLPFGIDKLKKALKADKAGRGPALMVCDHERYGDTYTQDAGGKIIVLTRDPRNVKAMLQTKFRGMIKNKILLQSLVVKRDIGADGRSLDFELGADRQGNYFPLLGVGIFTQDGHGWTRSRQLLKPHFMRNQDNDLAAMEVHVQRLIERTKIISISNRGGTLKVDLQDLFLRLSVDFATECLFGKSTDSLLAKSPNQVTSKSDVDLTEAINVSLQCLAERTRYNDFYWMVGGRKFKRACRIVHSFVDANVYKAMQVEKEFPLPTDNNRIPVSLGRMPNSWPLGREPPAQTVNTSFLEALTKQKENAQVIRDQLLNLLVASRDTTANFLAWIFYVIARDKRVFNILRQEVVERLGEGINAKKPAAEDLNQMIYLKWVLNETLRLYPLVPMDARSPVRTTTLPAGGGPDGESPILIPAGSRIGFSIFALQRRREFYGEDAHEYRPERWGEEKALSTRGFGWNYIPFIGGPRVCLGKQFALMEAAYVTCRILQQFDTITPVVAGENSKFAAEVAEADMYGLPDNVRYNIGLTMGPADGVWVDLKPASQVGLVKSMTI